VDPGEAVSVQPADLVWIGKARTRPVHGRRPGSRWLGFKRAQPLACSFKEDATSCRPAKSTAPIALHPAPPSDSGAAANIRANATHPRRETERTAPTPSRMADHLNALVNCARRRPSRHPRPRQARGAVQARPSSPSSRDGTPLTARKSDVVVPKRSLVPPDAADPCIGVLRPRDLPATHIARSKQESGSDFRYGWTAGRLPGLGQRELDSPRMSGQRHRDATS